MVKQNPIKGCDIIKKYLILISLLIFGLICISSVSASDLNNDAIISEVSDDFDDAIKVNDDKTDVNIITKETIGVYGNKDTELTVLVKDKDGNNVTGGSVTFLDVFGKDYVADVKDGVASSEQVFVGETGMFNITCNYNGLDLYNNASSTFLLNVPVVDTYCKNVVATRYGDIVYFTGNVVANFTPYHDLCDYGDDEEVTEGNVTVYVDGEKLGTCDVDVNGNYVYIWKTSRNLLGETINFKGCFTNNRNHFNPSNFSNTFTFPYPNATEISYTKTISDDAILISGTVLDDSGSAVVGGVITVDDVYSIPVDRDGKFSFYITNRTANNLTYEIGVIDFGSKADITINEPLMNSIKHTEVTDMLIDLCIQGSPYIKFGNGNGKTVIVNAGTHGGELPPQLAAFEIINLLVNYADEIDGTIYVFPMIFPEATANNVRIFNGTNLNLVAAQNGSISNELVKFARSINASGLGDFHSTRHADSDVGITCIMGSLSPTYESSQIAHFVSNETGYYCDIYKQAGVPYAGAIEDYSNILGGPAITAESLCNHRAVEYGTPEISFNSMRAFLKYFGFDINEMINIPIIGNNVSLTFTSPYNYNSSNVNIDLSPETVQIVAKNATYTINYGGKYSITLKDSNGTVIGGKNVTFKLAGKSIGSATTNSKGIATIVLSAKILKTAKSGKKNLIVKFSDNNYAPASKTVKITINKEKTKLAAKAKSFKSTAKTKKYTVILKNSKNKVMKKAKVTLKVNGKKYVTKTDSKGKATFKIIKLTKKGTFKATVKYAGNDYYKSASKTVKLTVK